MNKFSRNTLIEIPVFAAIAFLLSFIPLQTGNAAIDISLGMIPLTVIALRRGVKAGVLLGLIWSLLSIITGKAYVLNVVQGILEYPIAFSAAGLGGLFSIKLKTALKAKNKQKIGQTVVLASFTAAFSRWFFHFIAGATFWGSYAPKGVNVWIYSAIPNGTSAIANTVVLILVLGILVSAAPALFLPKQEEFSK
ncbi:MAG: energy-coupled thiamine transporter ThiT [Lactobacillales bacterium]|jgi:thiamine transporter|nr:energy-coupled thiamine transporter ThiT [Lactobacillales bacterium]